MVLPLLTGLSLFHDYMSFLLLWMRRDVTRCIPSHPNRVQVLNREEFTQGTGRATE